MCSDLQRGKLREEENENIVYIKCGYKINKALEVANL